jgi:UDPglucose 6-dehydrogenase
MKARVIFDGRNLYRLAHLREQGYTYYSVGRSVVRPD